MSNVVEPIGFGCHRCGGFNAGWDYCPTCRIVELQAENFQLIAKNRELTHGLEEGHRVNQKIIAENKRLQAES